MTVFVWTGKGSTGSAADPDNWADPDGNPGTPGINDVADFGIGAAVTGVLGVASISISSLVNYDGGSLTTSGGLLVNTVGAALDLQDDATGQIVGDLAVGQAPSPTGDTVQYDSTITIDAGSTLTVDGDATVGGTAGSSGALTVDGKLMVDGDLNVGVNGLGVVYDDGGTITVANGSSITMAGGGASYQSLLELSGSSAVLNTDEAFVVGSGGEATFVLTDGASYTTVGSLVVGDLDSAIAANAYGYVEIDSSLLTVAGDLILGEDGAGVMAIRSDDGVTPGFVTVDGNVIVGNGTDSSGSLNLEALGTLTILDGGSLTLGLATGSNGTLAIDAASAKVNMTGALVLGLAGVGQLAITGGGALTVAGDQGLAVDSGGSGIVFIATGGAFEVGGTLDVGQLGAGTVDVRSGGMVGSAAGDIGEDAGGTGTVTIDGVGASASRPSTWTVTGAITVGDAGSGSMTIDNGGVVMSAAGNIGTGSANDGVVIVDGTGSSWTMSGALTIGAHGGTGTTSLTISDDASVSTSSNQATSDDMADGSLTLETGGALTETNLYMENAATLTVEGGAVLTETGYFVTGAGLDAPVGLTANGTIKFDDGTFASANAFTAIGFTTLFGAGAGTLTASDGSVATTLFTYIGYAEGDDGTLTLTDSATTWTDESATAVDANDAGLNVGVYGTGSLTVEAGAVLANPLSYVKIGQFKGADGTALVTGSGSMLTAGGLLRVGDSGTGTLTVNNDGAVSVGQGQVGDFSGASGTLDIDSGGSVTTNSASTVDVGTQSGNAGPAAVTVTAGEFDIGVQAGSAGTVDVDGGTLTVEGTLIVGDAGSGSLSVEDGGVVTSVNGDIGTDSANDGVVIVDGTGSSWTMSGSLTIGAQGGTGTTSLTISDDASVTSDTASSSTDDQVLSGTLTLETGGQLTESSLIIGNSATLALASGAVLTETGSPSSYDGDDFLLGLTANGTTTIDDATLASAVEYNVIGEFTATGTGTGVLTASDGATITSLATDLAEGRGDSGTLILTGAGTTWSDSGATPVDHDDSGLNVGVGGTGSLTVEDGAVLSNPLSYIKIGQFGGTTGTALVTGNGSMLAAGGLLRVGDSGTGTLTVQDAGLASVGQGQVGDFSGSSGTLNIDSGGAVTTNSASTVDVGTQDGATVTAGEFDIGVQSGSAGTVDVDAGTLTVEGTLTVGDAGSGSLSVEDGGVVSAVEIEVGEGTGTGTLTLGAGGAVTATTIEVGPNGTIIMDGGVLDPPNPITIDAGGSIDGSGMVIGSVKNDGILGASGGKLVVAGAISGTGEISIGDDASVELDGTVSDGQTIKFTGASGVLDIKTPATFGGLITGYVLGDEIDLAGIDGQPAPTYTTTGGDTTITYRNGVSLTLVGDDASGSVDISPDDTPPACFVIGTRIRTQRGDVAVETLLVGDRVPTQRSKSLAPIRWIGRRHVDCRRHPDPRKLWPVRVRAGALAEGKPQRDLWLSPDHAVFVEGLLIPIRRLINGASVAQVAMPQVTYFHVELDRHDILFAEGLEAESYLDTGNRSAFENGGNLTMLHPGFAGDDWLNRTRDVCASSAVEGSQVQPIWHRVANRSSAIGYPVPPAAPVTTDGQLRMAVCGRFLAPITAHQNRFTFALPRNAGDTRLISRASVPAEIWPWLDDRRRLGAAVCRIIFHGRPGCSELSLDHPALAKGWHDPEWDGNRLWRWTDGDATLPLPFGTTMIEIHLSGFPEYPMPAKTAAFELDRRIVS